MDLHEIETARADFVAMVEQQRWRAAACRIADLCNAGEAENAAGLLRSLAAQRSVSVSQQVSTIEAGSTMIGYSGRRIG